MHRDLGADRARPPALRRRHLPRARGRGAYRALLRARWDDAVALGTPALITQGGSMSRPILERLGFERVGEVHMLLLDKLSD